MLNKKIILIEEILFNGIAFGVIKKKNKSFCMVISYIFLHFYWSFYFHFFVCVICNCQFFPKWYDNIPPPKIEIICTSWLEIGKDKLLCTIKWKDFKLLEGMGMESQMREDEDPAWQRRQKVALRSRALLKSLREIHIQRWAYKKCLWRDVWYSDSCYLQFFFLEKL